MNEQMIDYIELYSVRQSSGRFVTPGSKLGVIPFIDATNL